MKPLTLLTAAHPGKQPLRSIALQFGNQHVQYQIPFVPGDELGGVVIRLRDGVVTVKCGDLAAEAADYLFGVQNDN